MKEHYYKYSINNIVEIDKFVVIQLLTFDKDYVSIKESHDIYEFFYMYKNGLSIQVDDKNYLLEENDFFIHPKNVVHSFKSLGKEAQVIVVTFTLKKENINSLVNRVIKISPSLIKYIHEMVEESKLTFDETFSVPYTKKMNLNKISNLGGLQVIKNNFECLLIKLLRTEEERDFSSKIILSDMTTNKLCSSIMDYLKENIYGHIKISDLEHKFNYNKSYLFFIFNKHTGLGIIEYFNILKIQEAKKLLSTNKSVKQISEMLGYENTSYFCKMFKKIAIETPLQYRKRNLN